MKTSTIFLTILLSLVLTGLRAQHVDPMDPLPKKPIHQITDKNVISDFQKQLGVIMNESGNLSDAFAAGNAEKIKISVKKVKDAINDTDLYLLNRTDHMTWLNFKGEMNKQLVTILTDQDINAQRKTFAAFNETLHKSVEIFGTRDVTSFFQYCPMAFENAGAFWFSNILEIHNPYLEANMSGCGMTREIIQ